MKAVKLILGIVLVLAGSLIVLGTVIVWQQGSSEFSADIDILAAILFGIVPAAGGIFLCWHAIRK